VKGDFFSSKKGGAVAYRFGGAGGQEKDDEIFIGAYTAEYWEYDSRLGRRWNVDPVVKPWESGYATLHNNPLFFIDPLGLDPVKRLSLGKRINNFFKGDSYKNRANKHIVDNKIDDSKVKYERGKITIDESYNTASKDEDGYIKIMHVSKITAFVDENPVEGNKYDWAGNSFSKSVNWYAGFKLDYKRFQASGELGLKGKSETSIVPYAKYSSNIILRSNPPKFKLKASTVLKVETNESVGLLLSQKIPMGSGLFIQVNMNITKQGLQHQSFEIGFEIPGNKGLSDIELPTGKIELEKVETDGN
jgi:hypothetical protein